MQALLLCPSSSFKVDDAERVWAKLSRRPLAAMG